MKLFSQRVVYERRYRACFEYSCYVQQVRREREMENLQKPNRIKVKQKVK